MAASKTRLSTAQPTRKSKPTSKTTKSKDDEPPKKSRRGRKVASKYFEDHDDEVEDDAAETSKTGSKRKRAADQPAAKPKKAKKTKKTDEDEELPKPDPSQFQTLKYLLSPEALDLCRPSEEARSLAENPPTQEYRTYAGSVFTPFEELLSAIILSRPISHSLGHRSIRTILNPPYKFTTPKAIRKAGMKKVHQSMFDARTQHKEKTAIGICKLADTIAEQLGSEDDTTLEDVRKHCDHDPGKEGELLKSSIHGMGNTGLNIFFRRVQWLWTERFPFMDDRTEAAAGALGLPDDAEDLFDTIDAVWDDIDTTQFEGKDEEEKQRRAFVMLLERIIGAHLEKKITKVLREAEKIPDDAGDETDEHDD